MEGLVFVVLYTFKIKGTILVFLYFLLLQNIHSIWDYYTFQQSGELILIRPL